MPEGTDPLLKDREARGYGGRDSSLDLGLDCKDRAGSNRVKMGATFLGARSHPC